MSRPAGFAQALAVTEFRALWGAEVQSVVGDQLAKVALSLLVYQRTGSAFLTAGTYALTMLPQLVAGPMLSWIADRYPRRTVMVVFALLQAVLVAGMALPGAPLAVTATLLVLVQFAKAPFMAAQAASLPVVLSGDAYQAGQALRQITMNTAMLLGLAGGGLLVAQIGTHLALAIDAATFAAAAVVIRLGVRARPAPQDPEPEPDEPGEPDALGRQTTDAATQQLVQPDRRRVSGWQVVWRDRRLRALLALAWLAGIAAVPEGLAAPLADELGAGPAAVGWLLAADPAAYAVSAYLLTTCTSMTTRLRLLGLLAVGSVAVLLGFARPALAGPVILFAVAAGAVALALRTRARRGRLAGLLGVAAGAVVLALLAGGGPQAPWLNASLAGALVLLAVSGALAAYQVTASAEFMALVPDQHRGAAFGIARAGLQTAQGLGVAFGGLVSELMGSSTATITLAGVVGLGLAVPAALLWHRALAAQPPDQPAVDSTPLDERKDG